MTTLDAEETWSYSLPGYGLTLSQDNGVLYHIAKLHTCSAVPAVCMAFMGRLGIAKSR